MKHYSDIELMAGVKIKQLQIEDVDVVTLNNYIASEINFLVRYNGFLYCRKGDEAVRVVTEEDLAFKADKVIDATAGNFAGLTEEGNLSDSGKKPDDIRNITISDTQPEEQITNDVWLQI